MSERFLTTGSELLETMPNFKLIGRNEDLRDIAAILLRARSNSVLLHGSGGVGLSAVCYGLQWSKSAEDSPVPFDIINKAFLWLDIDGLFSLGTAPEVSLAFSQIMAELDRTIGSVLVIPDARDFIEGCRNTGTNHFLNMICSAIQKKRTQCIMECRDEDLDFVLKSHSDLVEIFTRYSLDEPVGNELIDIVVDATTGLVKHHGIQCMPEAIAVAIELNTKHRPLDAGLSRAQPERSITLLDRAFTMYRMQVHNDNKEMFSSHKEELLKLYHKQRESEQSVNELERELREQQDRENSKPVLTAEPENPNLALFNRATKAAGIDSPSVKSIKDKIANHQAIITENATEYSRLTIELNKGFVLTKEFVSKVFSSISGIDVAKLNEDEREKLLRLDSKMKEVIFGQSEALDQIVRGVRIHMRGKRRKTKPYSTLLLGPTGVGKTQTSKSLAENLFDDVKAMSRYDMGEYMEKHAVARLIGAPPGYEGFEIGGTLTNAGRKRPRQVFLMDEIEKAHPDAMNVFLPLTDEGILTDGIGRTVNFVEGIFIFTTNIGQEYFLDPTMDWETAKSKAMEDLRKHFRPEFLARFGGGENIICYRRLELESMERIVQRMIKEINQAYELDGIKAIMPDQDIVNFAKAIYDPRSGARGLPEIVSQAVEGPIIEASLREDNFKGELTVTFNTTTNRIETKVEDTSDRTRSAA